MPEMRCQAITLRGNHCKRAGVCEILTVGDRSRGYAPFCATHEAALNRDGNIKIFPDGFLVMHYATPGANFVVKC